MRRNRWAGGKRFAVLATWMAVVGALAGCNSEKTLSPLEGQGYDPVIDPANFVSTIDNPYFPLVPGTTFTYEGESDGESERNVVIVTHDTRTILGVTCVVVWDRVWVEDELQEETYDWYAQDSDGNVWYMGEDSKELGGGVVVSTEGSWEAGVDGAKPGIIMMAHPVVGESYRQEFYLFEAEDMARVLALDETASVPHGTFEHCLRIEEWTRLDPDVREEKYYAPGVGVVLETVVLGGTGRSELVSVTVE